jgi:hypothetical protein
LAMLYLEIWRNATEEDTMVITAAERSILSDMILQSI